MAASTPFSWRLTVEAGRIRLLLVGEVDVAAQEEVLRAIAVVPETSLPLVVELGGVTFLDGSGIAALMALTQAAVDRGLSIGFTDRPPVVDRVLDLTDTELATLDFAATAGEG